MRVLLISALILTTIMVGHGQSFEITEHSNSYKGMVGQRIIAQIPIKNLTNRPLDLIINEVESSIGSSQISTLCLSGDCTNNSDTKTHRIQSNDLSKEITSVLETGLVPGISSVKYLIYDRQNPAEVLEYELQFTIEEFSSSRIIYESAEIALNEIYPNPIIDHAFLTYDLKNVDTDAKVILHNVLGTIINEYELLPYKNKVRMETSGLNSGVYFYTLYLDGDGITTHKLVIKK